MKDINKVTLRGTVAALKELNTQLCQTKRFTIYTREVTENSKGEPYIDALWYNVCASSLNIQEGFDLIQCGAYIEIEGKINYLKYINTMGETKSLTEIRAIKVTAPTK